MLVLHLLETLLHKLPVRHRHALVRGDGAEAAAARAAGKVGVGLLLRDRANAALDPDLPLELPPVEEKGRAGVKDKAPLVKALQQHDAGGGTAVGRGGGDRHGVRFVEARGQGLIKPPAELLDGVGVDVRPAQARTGVLRAKVGHSPAHGVLTSPTFRGHP